MTSASQTALRTLFKRCVECPPQQLICPTCPSNQICTLVSESCDACAHMTCIRNPNATLSPSSHTNVGAIAGGVIGGVAFVLIVMALLWRFWIRRRRAEQELEAEQWEDGDDIARVKSGIQFRVQAADAASTRTRHSLASTILSRASNFITIAYIPGVTNQAPVPPIPAAYTNIGGRSPLSSQSEDIFFKPDDIRGSTYSDSVSLSSGNRDTQYTRQSITPSLARSYMEETYRDDATVEPMPVLTNLTRLAPRMVSIKSPLGQSPTNSTSSSKQTSGASFDQQLPRTAFAPSPRSFSGGTIPKAGQGSPRSKGRFPIRNPSNASSMATTLSIPNVSSPLIEVTTESESEEDEHARARRSLLRDSGSPNSTAASTPLFPPAQSPFFDASEFPLSATPPPPLSDLHSSYAETYASTSDSQDTGHSRVGSRSLGGLSAVIEEATKNASERTTRERRSSTFGLSPFGDHHAYD